nr:four helix bundle protein [Tannerella forsythia]
MKTKSYHFAIRIVRLAQMLQSDRVEFVLSRQILRSGTSIGALVREAEFGQSKADFVHKMSIALKEANETHYWLSLIFDTGYMEESLSVSLKKDCEEIISLLVSTVKTSRKSLKEKERSPNF